MLNTMTPLGIVVLIVLAIENHLGPVTAAVAAMLVATLIGHI